MVTFTPPLTPEASKAMMRNHKVLYLISLMGILATILFAIFTLNYYEARDKELFNTKADLAKSMLKNRMQSYTYALKAMRGLMHASDHVSQREWKDFIVNLETTHLYPGIQGLGYAQMIQPKDVAHVSRELSRMYDRSIAVHPKGKRDIYSAITYLEPQDKRNQVALGYDMYSHPIRQEAMNQARDTNHAALSAPVTLVQEIEGPIQKGILLYLPIYAKNLPLNTVQARREALVGFVYSPFRLHDLLHSIFKEHPLVDFALYDTTDKETSELLYQTLSQTKPHYIHSEKLSIAGRTWRLDMYPSAAFGAHTYNVEPYMIVLLISGINIFILGLLFTSFRTRHNLEASKRWLHSMLASSTDGLHIVDTKGALVAYSPSFLAMLGYDEAQAKTLRISDWDPGVSDKTLEAEIAKLSDETGLLLTANHRRKDGTIFPVELHIRAFMIDGTRYIFASARDISERKKAHHAFMQARKTAEHYLDIVDVIILVLDKNKNVVEINRKGCEIIGYSYEEVIGKNWIEHFIPERLRYKIADVGDSLLKPKENPIKTFENPILTKEGQERIILWHNTTLRDEEGNDVGILTSGEDVTERRIKDKLFMMQTRQAQMGEMLSMIAHQWRQPLTIINTIAAGLRLDEMFKEEQNSALVNSLIQIEEQTLHLSQTITDFKDFFKPNKPKSPTTLVEILKGAIDLVEHSLRSHGIGIEEKVQVNPQLATYRNEVLQVIMTLIKNSIDAFEEHHSADPKMSFAIDTTPTHALLMVTDNAGGIAAHIMHDIFLPYFTTKDAKHGTGLGLYMCKIVIEEHCGGRLEVSSDHKTSSTFTISLPLGNT